MKKDIVYRLKSIVSGDIYYSSTFLETKTKYIENGWFVAVKRKKDDKEYFFIKKDSVIKI